MYIKAKKSQQIAQNYLRRTIFGGGSSKLSFASFIQGGSSIMGGGGLLMCRGLYEMEEYSKALSFFERALDIKQRSLPANHPSLQTVRESIEIVKKKL
jgi:hypothetical protein